MRAVKAAGGLGGVVDGTGLATCRMYESWPELREGYEKSAWAAFGPPAGAAAALAALGVLYVVPPLAAVRGSLVGAVGYGAAVTGRYVVAERTGGRSVPDSLGHPASVALLGLADRRVMACAGGAGPCSGRAARCPGSASLNGAGRRRGRRARRTRGCRTPGGARSRRDVCEQAPQVGGKLGVLAKDGFVFDTGPSLLTLPAVYRDLFLATGGPLEAEVPLQPVDPVCAYRFADGTRLAMPNGPRSAIAAAWDDALGPGAGADWAAFTTGPGRSGMPPARPFLESPLDGSRTLLAQTRRVRDLRTVAPWRSLRDLGRQYLHHPHQRTFLDRYATYTGSDPRRAPAALATVPYVEQTFGAWYVPGGLRRLGRRRARPRRRTRRAHPSRRRRSRRSSSTAPDAPPASAWPTASELPPTSSSRTPTPRGSTATCCRRPWARVRCARSAGPSPRSRGSSCCSRSAAGRRG